MELRTIKTIDGLTELCLANRTTNFGTLAETVCTLTYGVQSTRKQTPNRCESTRCTSRNKCHRIAIIDLLYTPPAHRGYGYGRKILRECIKQLEEQQVSIVFLIVKSGTFITEFYEKMGFQRLSKFGCYLLMGMSVRQDCTQINKEEMLSIWESL